MNSRLLRCLVTTTLAWASGSLPSLAWAESPTLSEHGAVELALTESPTLRAALVDVREAEQRVLSAEGAFIPTLTTNAGYTHSESPRASANGQVTTSVSDTWSAGTELRHTFPLGTQVSLRVEGNRTSSQIPVTSVSSQRATLGPNYGLSGRATVTHPLLRGAGTRVGEAAMRQARLSRSASERARDQVASQLLRDVLTGYWELWYADRARAIEEQAQGLAVQQRDDAQRRLAAGDLAEVDLLGFETRVAELEQSVAVAATGSGQRAVELNRLMGARQARDVGRTATAEARPELSASVTVDAALESAMMESPEITQAQARLTLARERLRTAGENQRSRLDVEGYVQGSSLANRDFSPAASQLVTEPAVSAYVGVVFELPLSAQTRNAEQRAAELSVEAAEQRLEATRQNIRAQVTRAIADVHTSERRVTLAERTVALATRQVEAQQQRYARGAGLALEVQQGEDSLRRAQLSAERARVDQAQAVLSLEHLTGRLLSRYAAALTQAPPQRRASAR